MNIQSHDPALGRSEPLADQPHVVAPPPPAELPPETAPRTQTTQHRSLGSVMLHWALMLGGFAALGILAQFLG